MCGVVGRGKHGAFLYTPLRPHAEVPSLYLYGVLSEDTCKKSRQDGIGDFFLPEFGFREEDGGDAVNKIFAKYHMKWAASLFVSLLFVWNCPTAAEELWCVVSFHLSMRRGSKNGMVTFCVAAPSP